jgi:hypothetical protein
MQEDNNIINPEIKITISDGNITWSSDLDLQSTVFWLAAVQALVLQQALNTNNK